VEKLPNLGARSIEMLANAGITSEAQLRHLGAVAAYQAVARSGARPGVNLLWALEGALTGRHWQDVARTERLRLLLQLEDSQKDTP
jgi:DNA transformation protein